MCAALQEEYDSQCCRAVGRPMPGCAPQHQLSAALPVERAASRWIVSSDPDEHIEKIKPYIEMGFRHLVFHAPGPDQVRFLKLYGEQVLPKLRQRFD